MNADAGFDVEKLRCIGAGKEVEANIADNPCSKKELAESYLYFDEELYKDRFVIE